jgi:hypothetical protein
VENAKEGGGGEEEQEEEIEEEEGGVGEEEEIEEEAEEEEEGGGGGGRRRREEEEREKKKKKKFMKRSFIVFCFSTFLLFYIFVTPFPFSFYKTTLPFLPSIILEHVCGRFFFFSLSPSFDQDILSISASASPKCILIKFIHCSLLLSSHHSHTSNLRIPC